MRILILHQHIDSSREDELDVLVQAQEVECCLISLGHQASIASVATPMDIEKTVLQNQPDLVFNFIESFGACGHFEYLPAAILEVLGVPFTGNKARGLSLTNDKRLVKLLLKDKKILVPRSIEECEDETTRFIVKSAVEHASFGIDRYSVVTGISAAQKLVAKKMMTLGGEWIAEEFIDGREINVGLIETKHGLEILPPAEIIFEHYPKDVPKIIDYAAKWQPDSFSYQNTPRRFIPENAMLHLIAKTCWHTFNLTGYARIDLRQDSQSRYWVIDVNLNPCLTSDAGFIAAALKRSWTQKDIVNILIEQAANEYQHA